MDPAKDAANIVKHGVSLVLGVAVLSASLGEVEDTRRAYGESRMNAYGVVAGRLMACTYTQRGNVVRLISVRVASKKERATWVP